MAAYFAIPAFVGLMSFLSVHVNRSFTAERARPPRDSSAAVPTRWTTFDLAAVLALTTFSAVRFEVGTDWGMYYRIYNRLSPSEWDYQLDGSPQEFGYTLLSLALRSLSDSPFLIFWVTSALAVVPVYVTIKKKSSNPTMSLLLYVLLAFFVSPFNIIRQGVAVSLNFWANSYIDKNKTMFVLINAVAATFHASAILAAVVQLVVHRWRPSLKQVLLALVAAAVAARYLLNLAPVTNWLIELNPRYETYLTADQAGIGTYLILASRLGLLLLALALATGDRDNGRYMTYVAVGLCFLVLGTESVVLGRMEMYFGIFLVLLIPNQLAGRRDFTMKAAVVAAAAVYFGFFLQHFGDLLPYRTYL